MQLYNLADRGFSLRILIDVREAREPLTPAQIAAAYGRGQGIGWMLSKRIDDIIAQGFVRRDGERLMMTPRGRSFTAAFRFLQSLFRVA
jgi:hypothetical protein